MNMSTFTIQDIDVIRRKSGISYNEAVSLLKYHNGSLSQALLDLENNGRILDKEINLNGHGKGRKTNVFQILYRLRLKIHREDITIINLSSLFLIIALIFAPWIVIFGLLFSLVLGYRIRIDRNSREFGDVSLDETIKHAGENIKHTVDSIMRESEKDEKQPETEAPRETRSEKPASGTKPVDVEIPQEGEFTVKDDGDGYHEANIG
jgi:hypothetical protein